MLLRFDGAAKGAVEKVAVDIETLVMPLYERVPANLLTQAGTVQVRSGTSGEVEPVLVGAADRLWVTIGADHTGAKVIGRTAWRFEEVEPHWDRLILRSFIEEGGKRALYREGPLANIRPPRELIAGWTGGDKRLPAGVAMFCGPLSAISTIRPSPSFEMELDDPVSGRKLTHRYRVEALPIVA
jgi:hypothetical protein